MSPLTVLSNLTLFRNYVISWREKFIRVWNNNNCVNDSFYFWVKCPFRWLSQGSDSTFKIIPMYNNGCKESMKLKLSMIFSVNLLVSPVCVHTKCPKWIFTYRNITNKMNSHVPSSLICIWDLHMICLFCIAATTSKKPLFFICSSAVLNPHPPFHPQMEKRMEKTTTTSTSCKTVGPTSDCTDGGE